MLARYSNKDWPIAPPDFALKEWHTQRLLPFKNENQGVCVWAVDMDGSDDPPVYVDVDTGGAEWFLQAPTFSAHVNACVWDYARVLNQPALVQSAALSLEISYSTLSRSLTVSTTLRTYASWSFVIAAIRNV